MKYNIATLIIMLAFISVWNVTPLQAQDPAVTGAAFITSPLEETVTTDFTVSFANTSSQPIPNAFSVQITISYPQDHYGTDGVSIPTGAGAAYFDWVFLGTNTWRGTNNSAIPGFGGGPIVFVVEGILETGGLQETTPVNLQIIANFGDFNDNTANNNLAPALEIITAPLPVALINFDAVLRNNNTNLGWRTASEENNDYFLVERSLNGKDFEEIGKVTGNGTTSSINAYSLIDRNVSELGSLNLYYRLKQVDFDGSFEYSDIEIVSLTERNDVSVYPNPNPGVLYFSATDNIKRIDVYNGVGKLLVTGEASVVLNNNMIDVSAFTEGLLVVSMQLTDGTILNKKVLFARD